MTASGSSVIRKVHVNDAPLVPAASGKPKFWPVIVDDDEPAFASAFPPPASSDLDEATRNSVACVGLVFEAFEGAAALVGDGIRPLKAKIAELQIENERFKAIAAELRSKLAQVEFVAERLSIDHKGPPGLQGLRGRDGPPGPRGEKGAEGVKGKPAPLIVGCRTDPEAFTVQALLSDGSVAPPLNLMGLFQTYNSAASLLDDRDVAAAAAEARAETEAQTEAGWAR